MRKPNFKTLFFDYEFFKYPNFYKVIFKNLSTKLLTKLSTPSPPYHPY